VISPFWRRFAHHENRPLDIARMTDAARLLLGEHDWTAFSSAQADGESRIRTILDCEIRSRWDERASANVIEFEISANGFLRYMVRSIIGTLIEVGRGEKDSDTIQTAIVTGDRSLAGKRAPAHGLTLLRVDYEDLNVYLSRSSSRSLGTLQTRPSYQPDSLTTEGFIHCSYQSQLEGVLKRYYSGVEKVLILTIETDKLFSKLVKEPSTNDELFRISTAGSMSTPSSMSRSVF
jgi:hypothetical protein